MHAHGSPTIDTPSRMVHGSHMVEREDDEADETAEEAADRALWAACMADDEPLTEEDRIEIARLIEVLTPKKGEVPRA